MATLTVYDEAGGEVGKYEIDTEQIADRVNKQLLHDAVVMYQANLRQGSHNTRTRGEVSGSTKKMYRQKGTGNARAGSKRTNVRRGGGVARTIKPRDYSYRMNQKAIQLGHADGDSLARSMTAKLVVIDKLGFDEPKTQADGFGAEGAWAWMGRPRWLPRPITMLRFTRAVAILPASRFSRFAS